jgi:hypothetical protein
MDRSETVIWGAPSKTFKTKYPERYSDIARQTIDTAQIVAVN